MSTPRVSIAMPVWNSDRTEFHEALQSLLGQSFGDFELVISDNGSGEEARVMYEEATRLDARIRVLRHARNYGANLNFTYSVSQTRGEYFMWAADDDWRGRDYLLRTVDRLDRNPRAVSAGSYGVLVEPDGKRVEVVRFDPAFAHPRASERVRVRGPLGSGDAWDIYSLHRRTALTRTRLDAAMYGGDSLFVRELLLQGPIERVEEELFFYRRDTKFDMQALAAVLMGDQAKPFLHRYPLQHLALQLLVSVATNNVPIEESERAACLVTLAASLVQHGWLTAEPSLASRLRSTAAWESGDYAGAAALLGKALLLAPTRPFDAGAWRRLAGKLASAASRS